MVKAEICFGAGGYSNRGDGLYLSKSCAVFDQDGLARPLGEYISAWPLSEYTS
jgi:hypothetical protein